MSDRFYKKKLKQETHNRFHLVRDERSADEGEVRGDQVQ